MTLGRGRVIRATSRQGASALEVRALVSPLAERERSSEAELGGTGSARGRARVLKGVVADASLEAARRLEQAARQADEVVARAQREAASVRAQAYDEGQNAVATAWAAAWLRLRGEEARADERALERTIELARAMAERLLGEALANDPACVLAVARQALASVRHARRVTISAHPRDVEVLTQNLAAIGLEGASVQIHADDTRGRGSLFIETDLGSLDAQLTLQLDRLARVLREPHRP